MSQTVRFTRNAANVFFHILTQCNLQCRHCYINPQQHGRQRLSLATIQNWLQTLARRAPGANLVILGGEPTLHPDLPQVVKSARALGYGSITIDTNGYLFNDILDRISPREVDFISFSLDGATPATNDPIRGQGSFKVCTEGLRAARRKGFRTSLIYTVSRMNLEDVIDMPELLRELKVEHFFLQVIGLRGRSANGREEAAPDLQVSREQWEAQVLPTARRAAQAGIRVTYPKVYLSADQAFECAGRVADNYFVFPNGRVYRCPLCEDYPLHSLLFDDDCLRPTGPINEVDLFELDIPEGCVMNKLIQPLNLVYRPDGTPACKIACCLLKEELPSIGIANSDQA
ncbi:MAG: radical SAM protein [Desulfobacteraceae bacterium]|nr:MAG: radical SAM protein [Desulfobacteraceae bacterium]